MKSLLIKDIYGVMNHIKTILFMCLFILVASFPAAGPSGYIVFVTVLITIQTLAITFEEDEKAKWPKYAIIMPITRKEMVMSKFILLFLVTIVGTLLGIIIGVGAGLIFQRIELNNTLDLIKLATASGTGVFLALFSGSITILVTFKFGSVKGRILNMIAYMIPFISIYFVANRLDNIGIGIPEIQSLLEDWKNITIALLVGSVLLWNVLMYKISCEIVQKQELV